MSRSSLPPLEDEFTRALLGSAESDGPSPAAYAKAASTLGVGIGVGASLPAAAVVGAAGAAGIARWSSSLSAKLLLGVSGALVVGAGALFLHNQPAKPELAPSATRAHAVARAIGAPGAVAPKSASPLPSPTRSGESSRARGGVVAAPASSPGTKSGALNSAATKPGQGAGSTAVRSAVASPLARRVVHVAPAPARASGDSSLAEQVQSLDRARVALASGDSSSALGEIARYRATWPSGVFLTEASVLEIEALAARGERSRAQARAAEFVAAHPDSPQADRLRALIPKKNP